MTNGKSIRLTQQGIPPRADLREMLRVHIVSRALSCMEAADARRDRATASPAALASYRAEIRAAVRGFYGGLPAGADAPPPTVTPVSVHTHPGFRVENIRFESWPGWEVNASVFVPAGSGPFPVVICPCGHGPKTQAPHQLPPAYFARAGYLAITFDPPMFGEKAAGNDHFNDGVRDYLIGRTSSRYFVCDAIRCIDYASTRADADLSRGVAMTGVSGGGATTTFATLLDDRITVAGPACIVVPLADLDITQCYSGCPETHMPGRYAVGVDELDLICAAAPTPCLLMAGAKDEVYRIEDTRRLADLAASFYEATGASERFVFSVDSGGHDYPPEQARAFTRFMNRWLRGEPDRAVPELPDAASTMLPDDELRCHPRADVNMLTLAAAEADPLAAARDRSRAAVRRAAAAVAGVTGPAAVPEAEVGPPFRAFTHDWRPVMLRPEPGIELPATLLTAHAAGPRPAILHLDDAGRHRLLHRQGCLSESMRFLRRDSAVFNLLTVDLRGWGDTAPSMYPYEMVGWGSVDRYLAYATAALGDPIMAMRTRDALAALAWLRDRPEVAQDGIVVTGSGVGAIVALHVAAIDTEIAGVVTWDGLSTFRSLIAAETYPWPADVFLPNALKHYDLPDLAAAAACPVRLLGLRDGTGAAVADDETRAYREAPQVKVGADAGADAIVAAIHELFAERESR